MFGFGKKETHSDKKPINLPGTAIFKDGSWEVRMGPEFKEQLKDLPPEVQAEIGKMIDGIESGKVNPLTMGEKMCAYCGKAATDLSNSDAPNMCHDCQEELV